MKDFERRLTLIDKNLLNRFKTTYNTLHLNGSSKAKQNYTVIHGGMDAAFDIINKIKPVSLAGSKLN